MYSTMTKSISVAALMKDYAVYNHWANEQLISWLKTKPTDQMETEVPSSFPSIKLTLKHIWDTQQFWLDVLKKQYRDDATWEGEEPPVSAQEVLEGLRRQSQELADFIASLDNEAIQEKIPLKTPWFASEQPRFEFIQHCMNHSTYHRGQVVTIGRNLGFTDAPMTDYNFYLLMGKVQS
jgi:uncharacterized damage-inducible protein DinB